ncbi:transmembrane protein 185-like [Folsomia candida]|uniref:Uncharacterized protein n=1 Tax=Folsomia candida TaxID=158441 RepID=A0A226EQJ5_FOLCA|nr:transmembrane protein 185-like [Folsomia candida]XP_035704427.1 transmembrane protein 185-like [Folsomia candida]XP_035704428.1 transmembrane protein 185-like [Folsomia candida]OXA59091.1 hypothetical protein Fcan01_04452 [Folsomia candida]
MDAYYYKQTLRSYYTGPGLIRTNSNNGYSSSMLYAGQPLIKQSSSSPTKPTSKSSYSPWNSSSSSYSNNGNNNSSSTWGNASNQSYSFGSKKEEVKQENKKNNESGGGSKSINFESNIGVFNRQRDLEIRISFG